MVQNGDMICAYCKEPISIEEQLQERPQPDYHMECIIRLAVGSVGHQLGICKCWSKTHGQEDPPGVTLREGARMAWELSNTLQPYRDLFPPPVFIDPF